MRAQPQPDAMPWLPLDMNARKMVVRIGRLLNLFRPQPFKAEHLVAAAGHACRLCLVAEDADGRLAGSIRYWPITIAGEASLLLARWRLIRQCRQGIGRQLVLKSIDLAIEQGHWHWCFVSGERDYYPKLGFNKLKPMISIFRHRLKKNACISCHFGNSLDQMPGRPGGCVRPEFCNRQHCSDQSCVFCIITGFHPSRFCRLAGGKRCPAKT